MNVLPLLQLLGMNGTDSLPPLGQHWIDQLPFAHRLASMQDQSYMEGNFNKPDERTRQLHPSLTWTMALVKGGLAWVEGIPRLLEGDLMGCWRNLSTSC